MFKTILQKSGYVFFGAIISSLFIFILIGNFENNLLSRQSNSNPTIFMPSVAHAQIIQGQQGNSIADVAAKITNSVVSIFSTKVISMQNFQPFLNDPFFRFFFRGSEGLPQEREQKALGSGVIVSNDGYIITNSHVISNANDIKVELADKRTFSAKVVGKDSPSDIAVLKINVNGLYRIPFGDSSKQRVGDIVLAVGNPFGLGETVTMGIISAMGRANLGIVDYEDFIQTDAAINPGNSGGALVNMEGKLIGINTAILSKSGGYQGVGFAIPSNMIESLMNSLIKNGKVSRGWLGIVIQDLSPELSKAMKINANKGAIISEIQPGSPAQRAGFNQGDVIVRFNNKQVESSTHLRNMIASAPIKTKISVEIIRNNNRQITEVILDERPDEGYSIASNTNNNVTGSNLLQGITISSINNNLRQRFQIPNHINGVVIVNVDPGSYASHAGLQEGDIILQINNQSITNISDLNRISRNINNSIYMLIFRQGHTMYIALNR